MGSLNRSSSSCNGHGSHSSSVLISSSNRCTRNTLVILGLTLIIGRLIFFPAGMFGTVDLLRPSAVRPVLPVSEVDRPLLNAKDGHKKDTNMNDNSNLRPAGQFQLQRRQREWGKKRQDMYHALDSFYFDDKDGVSRDILKALEKNALVGVNDVGSDGGSGDDDQHKPTPWARIAYTIMLGGPSEFKSLQYLLPAIYHPHNIYYIHLDFKSSKKLGDKLERYVYQFLERKHEKWRARVKEEGANGGGGGGGGSGLRADEEITENIMILDNAVHVSWGSFSLLLAALYGMSHAVYMDANDVPGGRPSSVPPWDYWINLSASDMPLMSQDHIMRFLHEHAQNNVSFIHGKPYEPFVGKDGRTLWQDRSMLILDDPYIYRHPKNEAELKEAWAKPLGWPYPEMRPPPQLFRLYKGEFWVMLHREMAEYIHFSPDNQARIILVYATGLQVADEEFFQTVACNPNLPKHLHVSKEMMRFIPWRDGHNSPLTVDNEELLGEALMSGALFARKFNAVTPASTAVIEKLLKLIKHDNPDDEAAEEEHKKAVEEEVKAGKSEEGAEEPTPASLSTTNNGRLVLARQRLDRWGRWENGDRWYQPFCLLGKEGQIVRVPPHQIGIKKSDQPKVYPMEAIMAQRRAENLKKKKEKEELQKRQKKGQKRR